MNSQKAFSAGVLNPQRPCPQGLVSTQGDVASRFAVYRNNVQRGLINALAGNFPVVVQLVGSPFFEAMAQVFIQKYPPDNPVMSTYGSQFANFIEQFAPTRGVPYLADTARLERLCVHAFHAADASAVKLEVLARVLNTPAGLDLLRLQLHHSVSTLNSPYAIVSIWTAHQRHLQNPDFNPAAPQSALILRKDLRVQVFAINSACVEFVRSLQAGCTLARAGDRALKTAPAFDLSQALALLIAQGAIIGLLPNDEVIP